MWRVLLCCCVALCLVVLCVWLSGVGVGVVLCLGVLCYVLGCCVCARHVMWRCVVLCCCCVDVLR